MHFLLINEHTRFLEFDTNYLEKTIFKTSLYPCENKSGTRHGGGAKLLRQIMIQYSLAFGQFRRGGRFSQCKNMFFT